jgi:PAS domain S-box-containing protein
MYAISIPIDNRILPALSAVEELVGRPAFKRTLRFNRRGGSVATHLLWLVVAVMVPLLILAGLEIARLHDSRRSVQETALLGQARDKADLIDDGFARIATAISALAASTALEEHDFDRFEQEIRTVSKQLGGLPIGLADAGGNQMLMTTWPVGERRPGVQTGPGALSALTVGRTTITNLHRSPITDELTTVIAVPIYLRDHTSPDYVVTSVIPAGRVGSMIVSQPDAPGAYVNGTVLDQDKVIVARPFNQGDRVGEPIQGRLRDRLRQGSAGFIRDGASIDGQEALFAFATAPTSRYMVALGIPREVFDAPLRAALLRTFAIGALLLSAGALAAGLLARRLVGPLHRLAESHSGEPVRAQPVRTGMREIDNLALQLHLGAAAQDHAQSAMTYQLTLLRAVTESTADAIFLMDPRGCVTYANPASQRMFGWPQVQIVGHTLHQIANGPRTGDNSAWDEKLARALAAGGNSITEEDIFFRRDGQMVNVECTYAPVVVDNITSGAVLTVRDITARKRVDAALRENEARLGDLLSTLDLAKILVCDPDGTIRFWSHGCQRLYGWSAAEAVGQSISVLLQTVGSVPADQVNATMLRDGEWSGDLTQVCRDGNRITVSVRYVLQRGVGGEPRAIMESVLDVTALRRAQADLQQLNRELERRVDQEVASREAAQTRAAHAERMQALGQLAGGIAHDFNNILQVVGGSAALIERRPGDTVATRRFVRQIIDSVHRGATITRRMLVFARRGKLEAEAVDPAVLLEGLKEICTYTLGAGIEIQLELAADIPWLFADKGQLETALVNTATNARDAMPNGGVLTFRAQPEVVAAGDKHHAGLAAGAYVRIAVCDTGTGMDHAVLARVAEPFFTTKGVGRGTGLGLSMVKGFTEQSGGGFSVFSESGAGTVITLWLPQADAAAVATFAEAAKVDFAPDTCRRVLLVDDDQLVRETLAAQLEAEGLFVMAASDSEAALSLLRTAERIDVMVTDLAMPRMNGLALIQAAQRLRSRLPAILLSGYAEDAAALAVEGAVNGSYSLIRKPVSGESLADRIAAVLEPAR